MICKGYVYLTRSVCFSLRHRFWQFCFLLVIAHRQKAERRYWENGNRIEVRYLFCYCCCWLNVTELIAWPLLIDLTCHLSFSVHLSYNNNPARFKYHEKVKIFYSYTGSNRQSQRLWKTAKHIFVKILSSFQPLSIFANKLHDWCLAGF